jgi:hypothetical protein
MTVAKPVGHRELRIERGSQEAFAGQGSALAK